MVKNVSVDHPDDSPLDEFVVVEDGPASVGVPLDAFDGFEGVLNAVRI